MAETIMVGCVVVMMLCCTVFTVLGTIAFIKMLLTE